MYVGSLCDLANAMEVEARKLEKEGGSKSSRKRKARSKGSSSSSSNSCDKSKQSISEASSPGETSSVDQGSSTGTSEERATRLLRVLIIAFNAFLQTARLPGNTYSTR